MIGRTNAGGGGGKSIVLATNPIITINSDDTKLIISWSLPDTEVAIAKYNIYISEEAPTSLKSMQKVGTTTETRYDITGLVNGQIYYVAVESVGVNGYENASIWKVKDGIPYAFKYIAAGASNQYILQTERVGMFLVWVTEEYIVFMELSMQRIYL